jgi:hypothetical protein
MRARTSKSTGTWRLMVYRATSLLALGIAAGSTSRASGPKRRVLTARYSARASPRASSAPPLATHSVSSVSESGTAPRRAANAIGTSMHDRLMPCRLSSEFGWSPSLPATTPACMAPPVLLARSGSTPSVNITTVLSALAGSDAAT